MGLTALHRIAFLGLKEVCRVLLLSEGIQHFAKAEVSDIKVTRSEFNCMKYFTIQKSETQLIDYIINKLR